MSKVIIPNFVAAHIENDKDINFSIHESINPGYMNDSNDKVNRWLYDNSVEENDKRILTFVRAWVEGYEIEPELKYYWRKKKEYLVWFENIVATYLHENSEGSLHLDCLMFALKATESEARDLLKHDFDKFEKVECE
ncbi:DUF1642 domain-containing protein [Vagococcus fluvialis]|uniref:DUF1642 domain-containing protein n=1 Tax=Vagococcus fluvialis TaxID=2738 RepID=UPI001A8E5F10|nr:DUF1642 domain-containing protein [Vagococcus fluvialis]MBO0486309.1 DUF1642 domain-containing protein [Vagococcus fluvialis]